MDTPTTSPAQWLHERVPAIAGRDAPQFELDCLSVGWQGDRRDLYTGFAGSLSCQFKSEIRFRAVLVDHSPPLRDVVPACEFER